MSLIRYTIEVFRTSTYNSECLCVRNCSDDAEARDALAMEAAEWGGGYHLVLANSTTGEILEKTAGRSR